MLLSQGHANSQVMHVERTHTSSTVAVILLQVSVYRPLVQPRRRLCQAITCIEKVCLYNSPLLP